MNSRQLADSPTRDRLKTERADTVDVLQRNKERVGF